MYVYDCFGGKIINVCMATVVTEIHAVTVVALIAKVYQYSCDYPAAVVATWAYMGLGTVTDRKRRSRTRCGQFLTCCYCC